MLSARTMASALSLIALSAIPANAAIITYSGEDLMTTITDPHPNSAAAAGNFAAATPGASVIDFESVPVGPFTSLGIAPGVTLTGASLNGGQSILDTSNFPTDPTLDGYNTTPGGSHFAEMTGGTLTFTFTTPIQSFGAYFSGVQAVFFQDTISFSDGTSEVLNIPETGTETGIPGALSFLGFTDFGKSITNITIAAGTLDGGDFIGVDDVRYQAVPTATNVPEPITLSLFGAGVAGAAALRRRRKAKQA